MSEIRVRIAPSPTGPIHVGNVHTGLFNWLWARHQGGKFILRFEDTDRERSRPEWETVIFEDLKWLGIDWDEGPDIGGPFEPYRQMERLHLYQDYAQRLLANDQAYYCYCTPEELQAEREEAQRQRVAYKYSRRCRHLTAAQRAAYEAEGRKPSIRFSVTDGQPIGWDDLVRGYIEVSTDTIGDFIICRPTGVPLYNFAVVIDDVTMKISHVIRGEGHISNTPVQILIYQALGRPTPRFGHVGHLVNEERGKLSKRKGEAAVRDYRDDGILPEALLNFLVYLGWTPEGGRDFISKDEMIAEFDLTRVTKAASVFDRVKLEWMNGHYIRQKTVDEFARLALPFVAAAGLITREEAEGRWSWFVAVMHQVQERVKTLGEVPKHADFFFSDDIPVDEAAVSKFITPEARQFFARVCDALAGLPEWELPAIETAVRGLMDGMGLAPKQSIQPIRVAVTGRTASPGLFEIVYLVGRERTLARLRRYL